MPLALDRQGRESALASVMETFDDGLAVAAARAALTAHWRSTVVPHEDGGWVVRTWTNTPPTDSRPTGVRDFVHRVAGDPGSGKLKAGQVHPKGICTRGTRAR